MNMLQISTIIGAANFLIFGILNHYAHNYLNAYVETGLAFALLINVAIGIHFNMLRQTSSVGLFLMIIALLFLLKTGGIAGTGIFWFYTFPPLALFLKGKYTGWVWLGILLAATLIIMLLQSGGHYSTPYSTVVIRQMLASLLATAALIHFYQSIVEHQQLN